MTFKLDYADPELVVGQRFVVKHRHIAEYILCRVDSKQSDGYEVAVLYMIGQTYGPNGLSAPIGIFLKLDQEGRSVECWSNYGPRQTNGMEYEIFAIDISIPDNLENKDVIRYVINHIIGPNP